MTLYSSCLECKSRKALHATICSVLVVAQALKTTVVLGSQLWHAGPNKTGQDLTRQVFFKCPAPAIVF